MGSTVIARADAVRLPLEPRNTLFERVDGNARLWNYFQRVDSELDRDQHLELRMDEDGDEVVIWTSLRPGMVQPVLGTVPNAASSALIIGRRGGFNLFDSWIPSVCYVDKHHFGTIGRQWAAQYGNVDPHDFFPALHEAELYGAASFQIMPTRPFPTTLYLARDWAWLLEVTCKLALGLPLRDRTAARVRLNQPEPPAEDRNGKNDGRVSPYQRRTGR